jgi:hypothetical protein
MYEDAWHHSPCVFAAIPSTVVKIVPHNLGDDLEDAIRNAKGGEFVFAVCYKVDWLPVRWARALRNVA